MPAMSKLRRISILSRLKSFPQYMRDPSVSALKKWGVVLLIAWILSPVDLIPELFTGPLGLLDDLGILSLLTGWMYNELGSYRRIEN